MTVNNTDVTGNAAQGIDVGPKIDVTVRPITPRGNLLGFGSVTIEDSFKIDGFRICSGEKGMFVSMPATRDNQGKWRDVCWPVTGAFRQKLSNALLDGYDDAIVTMQATLDASREDAKSSVTGALKENAGKVAEQPVRSPGSGRGGQIR